MSIYNSLQNNPQYKMSTASGVDRVGDLWDAWVSEQAVSARRSDLLIIGSYIKPI